MLPGTGTNNCEKSPMQEGGNEISALLLSAAPVGMSLGPSARSGGTVHKSRVNRTPGITIPAPEIRSGIAVTGSTRKDRSRYPQAICRESGW